MNRILTATFISLLAIAFLPGASFHDHRATGDKIHPVTASHKGAAQKFKLADLQFMAGKWKTTSNWGDMDEYWSEPRGNCMMCTYRCVKNGKVVFYEFIVIEQSDNDSVPVMKLRHFNPGSIGWEEKDKPYLYPMISLEGQKAVFERPDKSSSISYERISTTKLRSLLVQEKDGKKNTTEFMYELAQ
ncbi:MAG TPA: DUF6265 family protein [Chitinophagaceae bacterium]|nr:DUF6265 family protein [Chitinophagaceae bacterium]